MNHAQFIRSHLEKIANVQDRVIDGIIDSVIERYNRSDYSELTDMIDSAGYEINRYQLTLNGVTAAKFADKLGISVATARKRLGKDKDNVVCIKTKRPYIYKLKK